MWDLLEGVEAQRRCYHLDDMLELAVSKEAFKEKIPTLPVSKQKWFAGKIGLFTLYAFVSSALRKQGKIVVFWGFFFPFFYPWSKVSNRKLFFMPMFWIRKFLSAIHKFVKSTSEITWYFSFSGICVQMCIIDAIMLHVSSSISLDEGVLILFLVNLF